MLRTHFFVRLKSARLYAFFVNRLPSTVNRLPLTDQSSLPSPLFTGVFFIPVKLGGLYLLFFLFFLFFLQGSQGAQGAQELSPSKLRGGVSYTPYTPYKPYKPYKP